MSISHSDSTNIAAPSSGGFTSVTSNLKLFPDFAVLLHFCTFILFFQLDPLRSRFRLLRRSFRLLLLLAFVRSLQWWCICCLEELALFAFELLSLELESAEDLDDDFGEHDIGGSVSTYGYTRLLIKTFFKAASLGFAFVASSRAFVLAAVLVGSRCVWPWRTPASGTAENKYWATAVRVLDRGRRFPGPAVTLTPSLSGCGRSYSSLLVCVLLLWYCGPGGKLRNNSWCSRSDIGRSPGSNVSF